MSMSSKAISVISTAVSLYQMFFSRPSTSNNQEILKQLNKFFTSSMICVVVAISFITCTLLLLEATTILFLVNLHYIGFLWIAAIILGFNLIFLAITIYCFMRARKRIEITYATHPELINSTLFLAKQLLK